MRCNNCGHADSFVLLVELATRVATPSPAAGQRSSHRLTDALPPGAARPPDATRQPDGTRSVADSDSPEEAAGSDARWERAATGDHPRETSWSLAVQCSACDSTDVGVDPATLLAYVSTTRS
ncbi:hypothetical protein [Halomicrococcus gelatinilyticus]|uniref:hypothetical protein n=1 Tax=Halomicrococcus gelatinilyticus TaxID=1702103 RepID=UPI002E102E3E